MQSNHRSEPAGQSQRQDQLRVSLSLTESGPEVATEPVTSADLMDAMGETWRELLLRKGRPDVRFEEAAMCVRAIRRNGWGSECSGFKVELAGPFAQPPTRRAGDSRGPEAPRPASEPSCPGEAAYCTFPVSALGHVAQRAADRLIAQGVLGKGGLYYYRVRCEGHQAVAAGSGSGPALAGTIRSMPLGHLKVPLSAVSPGADSRGNHTEGDFPIFYTRDALRKCDTWSRRGATAAPEPIETGAVLCGSLCTCPERGELFVVIHETIEATDADEKQYSLGYSSRTWQRIQAVVRAIRTRPGMQSVRIVGQAHGHNFRPSFGKSGPCQECDKLATCRRTSIFLSQDDRAWTRSVFCRQPWAVCHIFGLTARGEPVETLFGLSGGEWVERGYHVIDDFEPARWVEHAKGGVCSEKEV